MDRWFEVRRSRLAIDELADALAALPLAEEETADGDTRISEAVRGSPIEEILHETAADWDTLSWGATIETTRDVAVGLFERRYRWTLDENAGELVERTAVSVAFPIVMFAGTLLVLAGVIADTAGLPALPFQAVGATVILCGAVFAANTETIVGVSSRRTVSTYLGVLTVVGATCSLAIVLSGPPRIAAAVLACFAAGWYLLNGDREKRLHGLTTLATRSVRSTPLLPRLHVTYSALAVGSLWLFVGFVGRVELGDVPTVVGTWLLVGVVVAILLAAIHGRAFSRSNVAAAVALTIAAGFLTALYTDISISSPTVPARTLPLWGVGSFAGALLVAWWAAWLHLASLSRTAARRFSRTGRRVDTRIAGIFAYLAMCCSAALGVIILVWLWTTGRFLAAGIGQLPLLRLVVLLMLGTVTALPAAYFVVGSGYQLAAITSVVRTMRRETVPADGRSTYRKRVDSLPFEPDYPVWVLDRDGYFAAAYTDPFDSAIVLSRGVFEHLSTAEIAAIVAHEESHFSQRGSVLQFYLAALSVFTLLGKNVVYGTYDFYARELTADEAAIRRLAPSDFDGRASLTNVLLAQSTGMDVADDIPQFFPTMVTVPTAIHPQTIVERSFHLLYGSFAGNVHPSPAERLEHLHNVDIDKNEDRV